MKMKNIILPFAMASMLIGQNPISAQEKEEKKEEVVLPVISKPAILNEGTQRELTPTQIGELLPWAKDSKQFLIDAIDNLESLPPSLQIERLQDSIKQVVQDSGPKSSELFMRYVLNRGLVISEILTKEMDQDAVGSVDTQLRVLKQSIVMALKYYDVDLNILNKKLQAPYKNFGVDYFDFLTTLNNSIFDASAQYNIHRTALEFLQWDLYRDLNNKSFAPQIVKINNSLKFFPTKKMRDADSIALIRQMKKVTVGLSLGIRNEDKVANNVGEANNQNESQANNDSKKASIEEVRIGSIVMAAGYKAKVVAARGDGQLVIEYINASGSAVLNPSDLSSTKGCVNGFCVGDTAIDSSGYRVTVMGVKKNGLAYIYKSDWSYAVERDTKVLGRTEGCNKDTYCVGETVINDGGYLVTITGIKNDKEVSIFKSDWAYSVTVNTGTLSRTKGCADRNICVKDTVYLNGVKVTVTGIKSTNIVRVFKSDWAYSLQADVNTLGTTK